MSIHLINYLHKKTERIKISYSILHRSQTNYTKDRLKQESITSQTNLQITVISNALFKKKIDKFSIQRILEHRLHKDVSLSII